MPHSATIYHNPRCGTSRTALQALQDAGYDVTVIEYLKTPPSRQTLAGLIQQAGLQVRDAIRAKEAIFQELKLDDPQLTDEDLLNAMLDNPILINRPFVMTEKGVRLCRPAEVLNDILG
ncbi:arsenate reductase (glutaredoxin) [Bordetella avium]|uniref:arsenate reductase (glutaredoxin) n=1 Tax=Bordetella avium TaxID=521 RepID=UPI000E0C0E68|nr:arsenate reductase (glutaredoxin) [Bordetella avium]AZY49186.1 arsenate reductase (glutaredoxin) [Bordetella avium]RIQ12334.1 arsenate reductase (glutaredoxin) [Bordetella avium]RIQ36052.1 arsenate reductase (glutaredoxin) [Bordetella avium]RIQ40120.1 arsenate reductase (glutaredoxin) [Bordetella avium]RIQ41717.1 arsenate reductase (glutaredoxin) [Bordetella avium]